MNTYKMIWEPKEGHTAWMHTFDMASDDMAIKYAQKIMSNETEVRLGCTALQLWKWADCHLTPVIRLRYKRIHMEIVEEVITDPMVV